MENNHIEKREIRIFISSTFRDFMKERDLLVKEVFPALRRKCAQRFVTLTEVDLRWGITEEQANEGQVLPLCLAEIERSRPYFIGLLGERYGWVPDEIALEVIKNQSWLKDHVKKGTSVTELEILHGVLNNPSMENHAFFYFRDPAYVNSSEVSEKDRRDMVERNIKADVEKYGEEEATRLTKERKEKLADLKKRIKKSGFPVVESYPNPKELAKLILERFDKLIDELYPEDKTPDHLEQERRAHEAHAKNKLFACIDRPKYLEKLDDFATLADHQGKGLVITGVSGGGKTSLLAAWSRNWSEQNPEDVLFQHYFGATPDSASPDKFLRRLMGELKEQFSFTDEIPNDPEKLREALPLWLARIPQEVQVVLVLDGLNQIQGTEVDRSLQFLPWHFPPPVTVIASALEGPAVTAMQERGWVEHDLPLASQDEIDRMVGEYFRIYGRHVNADGKPLQTELRKKLVAASGTKNPLYLRSVLEELRQFGSFEELPDRVAHYLRAKEPAELFQRILARWQEDFDGKATEHDKPQIDLVGRTLTHLWAARQGLSETEWLDLLGNGKEPLPRAFWTPLFLAMEPHLSQRGGLYVFGHNFLRQAAETAFVASDDLQRKAHMDLAHIFIGIPWNREANVRKTKEMPWQLMKARNWHILLRQLRKQSFFRQIGEMSMDDLREYWGALAMNRGINISRIFRWEILILWICSPGFLYVLQRTLQLSGEYYGAFRLAKHLRRRSKCLSMKERLDIQYQEAVASLQIGRVREAEKLFVSISKLASSKNYSHLQAGCLENLGLISMIRGRLEESLEYHKQAERKFFQISGDAGALGSLYNQTLVLKRLNRFDQAQSTLLKCWKRAQQYGMHSLQCACLQELANYAIMDNRTNDATEFLIRKRRLCQQINDKRGLITCAGAEAEVSNLEGDPEQALAFIGEKISLCNETGEQLELFRAFFAQAELEFARGHKHAAYDSFLAAERIAKKCGYLSEMAHRKERFNLASNHF